MASRIVIMDKDPGRLIAEVQVDLPHPHQFKSEEFQRVIAEVYGMLAVQTEAEAIELGSAPGEQGHTRALPKVAISDLACLLEHLSELPGDWSWNFQKKKLKNNWIT